MDKFQQKIKSAGQLVKHFQSISLADLTKISIETALKIIAAETKKAGARKTAEWAAFWIDFAGIDTNAVTETVMSKNIAYGNAIEEPAMIFCNDSPEQRLLSRLDDKASRLLKGEAAGEDTMLDIAGYLFILIALRL